jgi:NAD(P)-dependent dehydrogenase (short-subunit alcohol dehydrogenase family)
MILRDQVAVVTGAASGIGRALSERFAQEGARAVVLADRDAQGATDVAAAIGERASAVACDVADRGQIAALISRTEATCGCIDLFCANAGILQLGGLEASNDVWEQSLAVNLMAHVRAARELVPRWSAQRRGYLLITASAAGLLTQPGSAPYAVSKHAAVALAEWLAIAYAESGIRVSCLCPMVVDTPMVRDALGAAGRVPTGAAVSDPFGGRVRTPEDVADAVVKGLAAERFLILPHGEALDYLRFKVSDYDAWLEGMRHVQGATG